mmetsp:Transcript_45174/g.133511  ORF Transcript_45174/g.133511 Transcript_45174/m.133511 type:complete len:94 (+) Transcript_45174:1890-2171(+)
MRRGGRRRRRRQRRLDAGDRAHQIERVSVSSAPEAAPNAAATSSNVAATDAGEMAARWQLDGSWMTAGWQLDAQARPRKGSKAVTAPAQVEMA